MKRNTNGIYEWTDDEMYNLAEILTHYLQIRQDGDFPFLHERANKLLDYIKRMLYKYNYDTPKKGEQNDTRPCNNNCTA